MAPTVDQLEPVRMYEQPAARFGAEHLVRDEIPAINPEIIDMLERQDELEALHLSKMATRKGAIAVADVVSVEPQTGLYL